MNVHGSIALVSGGNRGLGKAYVQALLDAGARKVYVGMRHPTDVSDARLQPIKLDITNEQDVNAAVKACQDITILINNAGVATESPLIEAPSMDGARQEIEINYLGTLAMCRAFAPVLKRNGGGVLVNMLSVVSWYVDPVVGSYSASKAAEFAMTNGVRIELRRQGTLVVGVYAGYIDTDMTANFKVPKSRPEDVARNVIKAINAGEEEVLADEQSRSIKAALKARPESLNERSQQDWDRDHPSEVPSTSRTTGQRRNEGG
ncbi:SDR family oxidoreductase [Ktedonospora formicarum]|uniref:Short-chain dehydrogenase/reductase n=1 Tax=Ktedonospora formicarum TaxID=2778364 RepID=A0A8J3I8Y3_9CHLR|nr:SDR family oxidoreductase [Ktedonospora formicarum]GHO47958.1 short-chain dehydrogenase/reductase [Ktedonospora formicarum]